MEPPKKQTRVEDYDIKKLICTLQYTFFERLKKIEDKIGKIASRCNSLEEKVETILCCVQGVPAKTPEKSSMIISDITSSNYENNSKVNQMNITTNTMDDYPNGSWLGDPENPDLRLRCHISPVDLAKINQFCTTAEKMSLTLLDYLFEREVQACSNLSGTGKHGKKQLDPHKIFGIRCHVAYKFGTTEEDWNRIKLNIDSKCRTQFHRKLKGKSLAVKGMKKRQNMSDSNNTSNQDISLGLNRETPTPIISTHSLNREIEVLAKQEPQSSLDFERHERKFTSPVKMEFAFSDEIDSQFIDTEHGRIEVIKATKEQYEQLKQNPQVEFLPEIPSSK